MSRRVEAYEQRPRLFAALETAFPVKFQVTGSGDADAAIVFATRAASSEAVSGPTLTLVGAAQTDQPFAAIGVHRLELGTRTFPWPHANGLVNRTGTSPNLRGLGLVLASVPEPDRSGWPAQTASSLQPRGLRSSGQARRSVSN